MKRLQFRHNDKIWGSRDEAIKYFKDITTLESDSREVMERSKKFGESLYAEPMVAKYLDEEGNEQIILAIGVNSGKTSYHLIDSKQISELISANTDAINAEIERALAAEEALNNAIIEEIERAEKAELSLSGAIEDEKFERIAADKDLQTQINNNIATIVPITENLGANVREEFVLKNAKGEELGSHIKIYKDSALVGADVNFKGATGVTIDENGKFVFSYSGEADKTCEYLYLVYRNENGSLNLVALDFENFLMESEEGLGINIIDHKITIKIKDGEKYLTTTENGLQTINIDETIESAIDSLANELHAKIDAEIERSKNADDYISGLTAEFSASTVNEFSLVNSVINAEIERSVSKDKEIDNEIATIKVSANTLDKKVDVEIARSKNEDENFRIQIEHITTDLATEISNRELANASIRGEFAAADIALGSRIDTEAEIRSAADALLTTTLNETSEKLAVVEGDYLKQSDKNDVLNVVSAVQITAINATNAAVSAQTTADEAKVKIDGFMAAAEIGGAAIDTLIELQNYIKNDGAAASEMLNAIAENKKAITDEVERAENAEETLEGAISAETIARTESANILSAALSTEITRAMGAENVNATAIASEIKRANDIEAALQTALTTEINNRESADNAIRGDFATADESLKTRIAAEELARQTSYDALNTRIDNEATNRASAIATLTTDIINGDKAVRDSYEAADAVLQGAIQSETSNREAADAVLQGAIQSETLNRETADADIISKIDTERTNRETAISGITNNVATLSKKVSVEEQVRESKDNELNTKIETLSGNVVTSISNVVNEVNNKKVNDVVYDGGNNVIKLIFADGSYSEGFDASEFVVDGMLDNVSFDNNTNEIKFVWNTYAGKTEFIVPLDKFVDQYTVADDSVSFLKISDDNTISAIVDNANGFINTLASTNFVKNTVKTEVDTLSANTNNAINALTEKHDNELIALSANTNNAINALTEKHNTELIALSANTQSSIDKLSENINSVDIKVTELSGVTLSNKNDISTLSGNVHSTFSIFENNYRNEISGVTKYIDEVSDKVDDLFNDREMPGSIPYVVEREIDRALITNGIPITSTSVEDSDKIKSLIKEVIVGGNQSRYYVSANADDMFYNSEEGEVKLGEYITSLHNRIKVLEDTVSKLDTIIKDTIKSYIVGTEQEIGLFDEETKLRIGFTEDAIFGDIE